MMIIFNFRGLSTTREEAKELLPIMQAFADGKTIELCCDSGATWVTDYDPSFKPELCYRIKSEPKYRAFKNQEECWNEMLKHQPFGFVVNKDSVDYFSICRVFKDEKGISRITFISNPYSGWDMEIVFDRFNFADGTPFGIKEE